MEKDNAAACMYSLHLSESVHPSVQTWDYLKELHKSAGLKTEVFW